MQFLSVLLVSQLCAALYNDDHGHDVFFGLNNLLLTRRREEEVPVYGSLPEYDESATKVAEINYPWIARVTHSKPYRCTASCIEPNIFITAANCIYSLRVVYTKVIYKGHTLPVKAFILPSKHSQQLYDDVGIIVTMGGFQGDWSTIKTIKEKRTDNNFDWFDKLKSDSGTYKVVGYTCKMDDKNNPYVTRVLTELKVIVDRAVCDNLYNQWNKIPGFKLPCYAGCSVQEYNENKLKCSKFHGTDGGAVVNIKTNELLGVATWCNDSPQTRLPVGIAVPNSEQFFKDFECAKKISQANQKDFQNLCPK